MSITLTAEHRQSIEAHGERTYPHECCGIILGRMAGASREVVSLLPVDNDRGQNERHNRYTIPPQAYLQAEKAARAQKLDVLGFYHSHPNVAAQPSAYDLEHAWPFYAYVIVSVRQAKAQEMTCWLLRDDRSQFDELKIEVQG